MRWVSTHHHSTFCTPEYKGVGRRPVSWCERYFKKVRILDGEDACWVWIPVEDAADYERYSRTLVFNASPWGRPVVQATKWLYEWEHGKVGQGLELDHLCNNWRCVRPSHLEPVTPEENNRRYAPIRAEWTVRDSKGRFAGRRR